MMSRHLSRSSLVNVVSKRRLGIPKFHPSNGIVGRRSVTGGRAFATTTTFLKNATTASDIMLPESLQHMRLPNGVDPIPYSDDIPLVPIHEPPSSVMSHNKVTIVGCGQVGMAIAYALLNQTAAGTIALVDQNLDKLQGEAKDLRQGSAFHQNVRIQADSNYEVSAHSHVVLVTAGVAQKEGESRLNLLERNVGILQDIIPQVLTFSPHAAICIVSNPCDIMTAVANKVAGPTIPPGRIFGSGTCLDSSRLRSLLGESLDVNAPSIAGYVIGEHGDSSVPVWSSVSVGGVPILSPGEEPNEVLQSIHREVVGSAGDVIRRKGYTNWAVGLTGAYLGKMVLDDVGTIDPVSTCVRGLYGINEDVFLSLPCKINRTGVQQVVQLPLTDSEQSAFLRSAEVIWNQQKDIWEQL